MQLLSKYKRYSVLCVFTFLLSIIHVKAQFGDNGGPGDFDPPPPNDVPFDTHEWVLIAIAIVYGVYSYVSHYKKQSLEKKSIKEQH